MSEMLEIGDVEVEWFNAFWKEWPRRHDRGPAEIAFRRASRLEAPEAIVAGAHRYAQLVAGRREREMMTAVRWLNERGWAEDDRPAPPSSRRRRRPGPRRAPRSTAPTRPLTVEESRARWLWEHGVTADEYEARKADAEWLDLIKRRGRVR